MASLVGEDESATLHSSYPSDDGYQVFVLDIAGDELNLTRTGAGAEHGHGKGLDKIIGRGFVLGANGLAAQDFFGEDLSEVLIYDRAPITKVIQAQSARSSIPAGICCSTRAANLMTINSIRFINLSYVIK